MKKRLYSTFSKMLISFVLFGLLPLLVLSSLFFWRYGGILRDNLTAAYSNMTSYVSKNVGMILESADEAMGEMYDYQDSDGNSLADILKDDEMDESQREMIVLDALRMVMAKSEYLSSLRMVDYKGNIYSLYVSQDKTLRNDAESHTMMEIYGKRNVTDLMLLGTMEESDICVNSEDYIFDMVRNFMDTSTIESAYTKALGTVFADINVNEIEEIVQKSGLTKGDFYVYNTSSNSRYVYSSDKQDYLDGAHPLKFCESYLNGSGGYDMIDHQWVFYEKIDNVDAYAVLVLDNSDIMGAFFQSRLALCLILCFACAFLMILYTSFSIHMSAPTRQLRNAMEQVEEGNLDVRVDLNTHDEMEYVADGFNKMTGKLKDYINQVYVAQICKKDAELNALKMQIQPHYLYNTLDVIRMTALDQNDEKTAELLESLAHQLRYVMGTHADRIHLKDELDAIREYFVIMRTRYEGRISLMIYVKDEDLMLVIPKLLLQPMVENAIRHGLREKAGYGAVAIRVDRKPDHLEIVVMDDGIGMTEEQARHIQEVLDSQEIGVIGQEESVSVGMKNVYDRIKLNCGMEYGFTIQSTCGMGTIVTYRLPIWEEL